MTSTVVVVVDVVVVVEELVVLAPFRLAGLGLQGGSASQNLAHLATR